MNLSNERNTRIFNLPRATGKTMRMLYASEFNNVPIMCRNGASKMYLIDTAKRYRIKIPEPITVNEFIRDKHNYPDVLIDEAFCVLKAFLGNTNIVGMTFSDEDMDKFVGRWDTDRLDIVAIDEFLKD